MNVPLFCCFVSIASIGASWPRSKPRSRTASAFSLRSRLAVALFADQGFFHAASRLERSPQKPSWVKSKNYEVYSRSRLSCDCRAPAISSAAAAGLPPN